MEVSVVCNFEHICWSRGETGLRKLDFGRFPLVTRSSWKYQRRKRQEYVFGLLWKRTCYPCVHVSLKALKKGLYSASCRTKKIKIKFNLQAVVENGQQVYVCGSVTSLGTWDPELAIPMSPFEGKPDLWQAEIQVSCGTILEYNYFVRRGKIASDDFKWRPGPTLCLKVPTSSSKKTVEVQDRWCDTAYGNIPVLSLGSSWEDIEVPDQPNGFIGLQSSNVDGISAEYSVSAEYSESAIQQVRGPLTSAISGTVSGNIYNVSEEHMSPVSNAQLQIKVNGTSSELLAKGVFKKMGPDVQEHHKNLDGKKIVHRPVEESWLPSGFILLKEESECQNSTPGIELDGVKVITEDEGIESRNLTVQIGMDGCTTAAEVEEVSERELKLDNGAHLVDRQEGNINNVSEEHLNPVINAQLQIEIKGISSELLARGVFNNTGAAVQEHHKNLHGKKIVHRPVEESWLPAGFILLKEESDCQNLMPGIELDGVKAITENKRIESQNLAVQIGMDGRATVAEVEERSERELKLDNGAHFVDRQEKGEGVGIIHNKDVVTEIIINSFLRTTQRTAILEDGKLVEILLEPEETDVQVGDIYLSVVIFINHRMGTAFLDIGAKELAFLTIKETYPFAPLHFHVKECPSDGDLTNNARVEKDLKDEDEEFREIAVQEDEILIPYEYAMDQEEVIDRRLKGRDDMGELNKFQSDTNDLSITNVEARDKFSENGHQIHVEKGAKLLVQVIKESIGKKGPRVTGSPRLSSTFWVLCPGSNNYAVSHKIARRERRRLERIARALKSSHYGLVVRAAAAGHSYEELDKDLEGLKRTWEGISRRAKVARLAASEGVKNAVPVLLHRAMNQTRYVVQNYFNEKVQRMVVDSPHTYHEVTSELQEFSPSLVSRVELYTGNNLIFDEFGVETEIDNVLCSRVNISNGGYLFIEETEALVAIDVNSGNRFLDEVVSEKKPLLEANIEADILEVNLAAARQIARELRLRNLGGIIVVDFIDMKDEKHKRMVYEEIMKATQRDPSQIRFSELSQLGLMELSRKRVRPSLTYMLSESCSYCNENRRVEAVNVIFLKIVRAIQRLLVKAEDKNSQPQFILRVNPVMSDYLISGKKTRLDQLCTFLKVWIRVEVNMQFRQGQFEIQNLNEAPRWMVKKKKEKKRIKHEEKQMNLYMEKYLE